jgi:hypothetical protein
MKTYDRAMKKGAKAPDRAMKPGLTLCKNCPTPSKCRAAGRCLKAGK